MAFSLSAFRKNLRYETAASAMQIQAHLKQLAELDKLAEQKKKQYTTAAVVFGILAFVGFFITAGSEMFFLLYVVGALIAATIVTSIIAGRWNRIDLADVRYRLPQQLVEMLDRDTAKDAAFNIRLDFSVPTIKRKQTGQAPYPRKRGWKQAFYEDPWLHMSGQFLDSTTFDLTLTDFVVVRSGTKRSRSGKIKHKRKVKVKGCEAALMLKFPRKKYGAISVLQSDLPQAVNLPSDVVLKQIKANDHQLMLRAKAPVAACRPEQLYQLVTQLFLSAYQALNLSKELSKASV